MALNAGSTAGAATFGLLGPIAVIDLDAAMGKGEARNHQALCQKYRCRVGGGIRSIEKALEWLDAGAEHIIIGADHRCPSQLLRQTHCSPRCQTW